jgi:hypothetical protein
MAKQFKNDSSYLYNELPQYTRRNRFYEVTKYTSVLVSSLGIEYTTYDNRHVPLA